MSQTATSSGAELRWLSAALDPEALGQYAEALGYPDPAGALNALSRAVSASLRPGGHVRAVRVCRVAPPALALLAEDGPAAEAEIAAQLTEMTRVCGRLRFVGYGASAVLAAELARKLERRLGDGLRSYELAAIPRGGWLVAGLVAGHLPRLPAGGRAERAGVLIVDDCALTGVAFRRFARGLGGRRLVFATLLAARGLAREIERAPKVEAVEIGAELAETDEMPGPERAAWRRRWLRRLAEPPYWLGQTEFPCFPWNEPRRWIWNPVSKSVEPAWRLLAGERCHDGRGEEAVDPPGPGALRLADGVVAAEVEGAVCVGDLRTGASWRLEGAGAMLWSALTSHGDRQRAIAEVVGSFAVDEGTAAADLDRWLNELTARGLLEGR